MSAIEGNLRAIESCNDMVNRSVAGHVTRSQRLSQSHVKVGVCQVVSCQRLSLPDAADMRMKTRRERAEIGDDSGAASSSQRLY
jgi:hypothetical protein